MAQVTYPVIWSDLINTTVTAGNTLTKTGGTAQWDGAAFGNNLLPASTDGFLQLTYATISGNYMIGLATFNGDPSYPLIDYALYFVSGSVYAYEKNVGTGVLTTAVNNDVFRVSREGLSVKYYKNGVAFRTIAITAGAAANELFPDVSIYSTNLVIPAAVVSFNTRMFSLKPQYTFPSLANNDGGITILPQAGDAPFTYVWSSGETTASIIGKPRGNYTVTVTDAASRTASATYYLGYPAAWANLDNVNINGDGSLTRTNAAGPLTSGASSLNILPPNTDGYVEFVADNITPTAIIGLSDFDPDPAYTSQDFAIMTHSNGSFYSIKAGVSVAIGLYKKGDVFRVERLGATVYFYRNGVQFTTAAVLAAVPLLIDASLTAPFGPSPVVSASFAKQIRFKPAITYPDNTNANGSIALSVMGTYTPATIAWTPSGETGYVISGKSRGTYTATVNDAASRSLVRSYRLGYPVTWTDVQNATVNADNTLNQVTGSWTGGANSSNVLAPNTDGWLEFVVPRSGITTMIGLARLNSSPGYTTIDNAFYLITGNSLRIYELGADRGAFGYLVEGDVLTIAREGSNIKYYLNGTAIRTIATTPSYALVADISLNASLPTPLIGVSFGRTPQTFYSIANGNWNSPATWSLTEGGVATTMYPAPGDVATIKGFAVTVNTGINATTVNVIVNNDNTCLKVDTLLGQLTVKGQVNVQGVSNLSTIKALQVLNDAKLNIQSP